ncbi:MAG: lysophospholipid acyltransferase family protein [Phycisphaeraceae bacterium]|nr:lysophospholipid acyltransferase family protein [Phycisphaeraceae bacterium]
MTLSSDWVKHWGEFLAARLGAMAMQSMDLGQATLVAKSLGRGWFKMDSNHRERAIGNLTHAFPEWSPRQVWNVAEGSLQELLNLIIETFTLPRLLSQTTWPQRVRFEGIDEALALMNSGRPVLLLTGHLGNWEAMGLLLSLLGYPVHAIARPMNNPLVDRWLLGARRRRGLRIINKNQDESSRMLEVLDRGEMLGIVGDQNGGTKGLFVPFFGRLASTHKSIGLLAAQRKVPVIFGAAIRMKEKPCTFLLKVQEVVMPDDWVDQPDPVYYLTARFMHAMELLIRQHPTQYLWVHRRWKTRPRHEREGKPLPATLRRKIEALPWMDEPTLHRIEAAGQGT